MFHRPVDQIAGQQVRMAKLEPRWASGYWLGRSIRSNSHLIWVAGEGVVSSRGVKRYASEPEKWEGVSRFVAMRATPAKPKLDSTAAAAAEEPERVLPGPPVPPCVVGRGRLRPDEFKTPGCAGCHKGHGNKHSAECRRRTAAREPQPPPEQPGSMPGGSADQRGEARPREPEA